MQNQYKQTLYSFFLAQIELCDGFIFFHFALDIILLASFSFLLRNIPIFHIHFIDDYTNCVKKIPLKKMCEQTLNHRVAGNTKEQQAVVGCQNESTRTFRRNVKQFHLI